MSDGDWTDAGNWVLLVAGDNDRPSLVPRVITEEDEVYNAMIEKVALFYEKQEAAYRTIGFRFSVGGDVGGADSE
jgi:hypothetical protein